MRHASVARPILKFFFWVGGIILLSMEQLLHPSFDLCPHAGGVLGQALVAPLGGGLIYCRGHLTSLTNSITLWLWAAAAAIGAFGITLALMSAGWFGLFVKTTLYALVTIFLHKKPANQQEARNINNGRDFCPSSRAGIFQKFCSAYTNKLG